MSLFRLSALELGRLMNDKKISSVEVVKNYLERIEQVEKKVKAFITILPEDALRDAREIDARRHRGEKLHPLAGVPVAVKDNICTRGIETTCGSRILKGYIPPYNATVINRLRREGLIVIGKTNMDEFAMGSSTENSAFFPTHNPWDLSRVPGGSSGGSAAAVAAREVPLALGSDTGGSVRQPAAFCGVNGLRPTYGRVSRYGLIAFASSLDQIGTFCHNAADSWMLYRLIAGYDPNDSTSLDYPEDDDSVEKAESLKGLTVGIIEEQSGEGFDRDIAARLKETAHFLEGLGMHITTVSLSLTDYALAAYYIISPAEASSNLGRYDGLRYGYSSGGDNYFREIFADTRGKGFGPEVKRRIMLGTYALSAGYYDAYYLQALRVRNMIQRELESATSRCDLLLGPTTPTPAFLLGEKVDDPLQMYLSDICTLTAALAGYPAISVFAGLSSENLPVGLQFTAKPLKESLLFRVAAAVEKLFPPLVPEIKEPPDRVVEK